MSVPTLSGPSCSPLKRPLAKTKREGSLLKILREHQKRDQQIQIEAKKEEEKKADSSSSYDNVANEDQPIKSGGSDYSGCSSTDPPPNKVPGISGSGGGMGGLVQMLSQLRLDRKMNKMMMNNKKSTILALGENNKKGPSPSLTRSKNSSPTIEKTKPAASVVEKDVQVSPVLPDDDELRSRILRQIEYYFGDYNLPRDKFMLEMIADSTEGWIPMEKMLTFPRLAKMSRDPLYIMETLARNSDLMEVDFKRRNIRRSPLYPVPIFTEERKLELQDRTIFVAGFDKKSTTLDLLLAHFERSTPGLKNIRMRYALKRGLIDRQPSIDDESSDKEFIGSCFFTFSRISEAENFLKNPVKYDGKRLFVKWQKEYFNQRIDFNDTFEVDNVRRTAFVHGFDRVETQREVIEDFFVNKFDGILDVKLRCFKDPEEGNYWQFTGGVFVTFNSEKSMEKLLDYKGLKFEGDRLIVKSQIKFYTDKRKFTAELKKLNLGNQVK